MQPEGSLETEILRLREYEEELLRIRTALRRLISIVHDELRGVVESRRALRVATVHRNRARGTAADPVIID